MSWSGAQGRAQRGRDGERKFCPRIEVSVQTPCAWPAGGPAGEGSGEKTCGTSLQHLGE